MKPGATSRQAKGAVPAGLRWPAKRYFVSPRHRLLYCPIPKVACSSLKVWWAQHELGSGSAELAHNRAGLVAATAKPAPASATSTMPTSWGTNRWSIRAVPLRLCAQSVRLGDRTGPYPTGMWVSSTPFDAATSGI